MQGIYQQSLTGNKGQLGPFDPSIIYIQNIYSEFLRVQDLLFLEHTAMKPAPVRHSARSAMAFA